MAKHKPIPKKIRKKVYEKYNGHCAYCGCELTYEAMQVDHIDSIWHNIAENNCKPLSEDRENELNDISNLMPSCRMCNFYKSSMTIEEFRERVQDTLYRNTTETFQFRLAEKYGLVEKTPHKIKFYFEKIEQ